MRHPLPLGHLFALTALFLAAGCGSKAYEIDGFAGFSQVDVENFGEADGVRLAGNLSRTLITPGIVRGEHGNGLRINANVAATTQTNPDIWVLSPQIGPSFRLGVGGLYVEPGITGGGAYAELGEAGDDTEYSWAYRPYIRAGYATSRLILGVEGGIQRTGLAFEASEDPEEWYVGGFVGIRLSQ